MKISINGKPREFSESITLIHLIELLELNPRQLAVEVNRVLVPRAEHANHHVRDGDELEIVTLAGGG